MATLKRNYGQEGIGEKGHGWQWWSLSTPAGWLHIHTRSGNGWSYKINMMGVTRSSDGFDSKEAAFEMGREIMISILTDCIDELGK